MIEEMQEYDKTLNDGKDPYLLKTSRYWGPSYFLDEVAVPHLQGGQTTAIKKNFFVAEVEKRARYALPFARNISHFVR